MDFHIAFYIGRLATAQPDARFTIVSKDTGFDPLVRHLASLKVACNRTATINGSAKVSSPTGAPLIKPAVNAAVAAKAKPVKNVVVKILPEANGAAIKAKPPVAPKTERVAEVLERLKGLKSSRPAKLKSLQSSLKSWFKPALKPNEVASLIAALQNVKKIRVDGTKVVYTL